MQYPFLSTRFSRSPTCRGGAPQGLGAHEAAEGKQEGGGASPALENVANRKRKPAKPSETRKESTKKAKTQMVRFLFIRSFSYIYSMNSYTCMYLNPRKTDAAPRGRDRRWGPRRKHGARQGQSRRRRIALL